MKSTAPIIGIGNANVVLDPAAFEALKHPAYTFGVMYNPPDVASTIGMFGTLSIGKIDMKLPIGAGRTGDTVYRNHRMILRPAWQPRSRRRCRCHHDPDATQQS